MTPSALTRALESNSRQAEHVLRDAEQALYEQSGQQARLEHQIASKLGEIVSLQLQDSASLDQQTRQQLTLREQAQAALRQTLAQAERIIASTLDKQAALQHNLDQLDDTARDLLDQDPASRQVGEQLAAARQAEHHAITSYDEIRSECASKLEGYRVNPLYRFLKARQYGTEHYRPVFLQRGLDEYLARKVDFRGNHANEQTLLAMQARNETLRQARSEAVEQLQVQYDRVMDKAREDVGLHRLLAEQQVLSGLLNESKARAKSLHQQLGDFAQQRDPHLLQIRQSITERLKARPLAELILAAAQTPDNRDDLLVSELQLLHARLREAGQQQQVLERKAAEKRGFYDRAKGIEYALRTAHFQDSRHEYQLRHPIEQILGEYMRRVIDQQALEKLLNDAREYVPSHRRGESHRWDTRAEHASRSGSSYRSSSGSGSIAGGGFSTSSSSGGGGFNTTNSF